jgi:hypothetical protein
MVWHKAKLYGRWFSTSLVEYIIRKIQENQKELRMDDTHKHLVDACDINLNFCRRNYFFFNFSTTYI